LHIKRVGFHQTSCFFPFFFLPFTIESIVHQGASLATFIPVRLEACLITLGEISQLNPLSSTHYERFKN